MECEMASHVVGAKSINVTVAGRGSSVPFFSGVSTSRNGHGGQEDKDRQISPRYSPLAQDLANLFPANIQRTNHYHIYPDIKVVRLTFELIWAALTRQQN